MPSSSPSRSSPAAARSSRPPPRSPRCRSPDRKNPAIHPSGAGAATKKKRQGTCLPATPLAPLGGTDGSAGTCSCPVSRPKWALVSHRVRAFLRPCRGLSVCLDAHGENLPAHVGGLDRTVIVRPQVVAPSGRDVLCVLFSIGSTTHRCRTTTRHRSHVLPKERVERDEEDLVRLYLTDIGQYPLLTKDDEVRLAQQIEAGNRARTELDDRAKPHRRRASANCAARHARARTPSRPSSSPTCAWSSRSPRSTRRPVSRSSTSSRRATSG